MIVESVNISWRIGVRSSQDLLSDNSQGQFTLLANPWYGWCADPFLFEYKGEVFVFGEVWNHFKQRGAIGYYKVNGKNRDNKWHVVISERYHMSYPMIWKDSEGIHICAETCGCMDLHTYDCLEFPNKWRKSKTLISNRKLVDTTFLFAGDGSPEYCFAYEIKGINQGVLYKYDFKDGYPSFPKGIEITRDSKISRPGGMFLRRGKELYRVAQDCSSSYGEHLCFLRIIRHDPYEEELSKIVSFEQFQIQDCIGIHTYNKLEDYEVVDFRIHRFGIVNFIGTYIRFMARRIKRVIRGNKKENQ